MSTDWWMYHGNAEHTGYAPDGSSSITSRNVRSLKVLHDIPVTGPILSVPAIAGGFVYVGLANDRNAPGSNGGAMLKISLAGGEVAARYEWAIDVNDRDSHGFTGMGCTPAIVNGKVYFSAFNGKFYCLNAGDMTLAWVVDLRNADLAHNQPVSNTMTDLNANLGYVPPPAAGWSSPVVVMDPDGKNGSVYVGHGEGENPSLFGFVFCLDANTGNVKWIYCMTLFEPAAPGTPVAQIVPNEPNVLPVGTVNAATLPTMFTTAPNPTGTGNSVRGNSVWSSIAYDKTLNRLYCATGNPQPDSTLPSQPLSNGLVALDAATGAFKAYFQPPPESSYRATDLDVDIGGSPTLYTLGNGRRVVAIACKNGGLFVLDADTLELVRARQLLPYYNSPDGKEPYPNYLNGVARQIPTVDVHGDASKWNPEVSNQTSDDPANDEENYSGTYSTPAVDPKNGLMFIGVGGNNYHPIAAGIDSATTPFMRAMRWDTLADAWPMDGGNPPRYVNAQPPMYTSDALAGAESGLMSPAVVNDVVFCSSSKVSVYAFESATGTMLWHDQLGAQTGGMNGGYGYCMGPAVSGNYVVAGALIAGLQGGRLRIYSLPS